MVIRSSKETTYNSVCNIYAVINYQDGSVIAAKAQDEYDTEYKSQHILVASTGKIYFIKQFFKPEPGSSYSFHWQVTMMTSNLTSQGWNIEVSKNNEYIIFHSLLLVANEAHLMAVGVIHSVGPTMQMITKFDPADGSMFYFKSWQGASIDYGGTYGQYLVESTDHSYMFGCLSKNRNSEFSTIGYIVFSLTFNQLFGTNLMTNNTANDQFRCAGIGYQNN